jgi:proteic killer suppression protein
VIKSFANSVSRRLFDEGRDRGFSGLDTVRALSLLNALNAASTLSAISPLKRVGLHALKGDRKGQFAMSVNAGWRICFRFADGHAYDVEVVDYH